ncbi:MAG TPA: hypothetical protein VNT20_21145 [Flavisolibacter sp.]|jgi:hypothetical protein|nr:hypothetical protein [Flavisolibacter sp.]
MEILRFLFYAFLLYLGFRLVFDFIIPVVKTTRRIKKGFREMHERMNQHTEPYNQQENAAKQNQDSNKGGVGEYIDFEEVKN